MSEPTHTGQLGIAEAMEKLLAGITPKTDAEMRDYNFQERILPQLRMFGFEKRYCQDGLCDTKDERGALQKRVLAKLTNVLLGRGAIVALVGPRGTGKTYIASQYVIDALWAQMDTAVAHWYHYTKLTTIVARLKAFYGDSAM